MQNRVFTRYWPNSRYIITVSTVIVDFSNFNATNVLWLLLRSGVFLAVRHDGIIIFQFFLHTKPRTWKIRKSVNLGEKYIVENGSNLYGQVYRPMSLFGSHLMRESTAMAH